MTFLPLIERELRLRARRSATYWLRSGAGLLAVMICVPQFVESSRWMTQAQVGAYVFNGAIVTAFLLSCWGCVLTASALTLERREGTLGLLLLTRVRMLDVMAGKFGSVGLAVACALTAFLPILMLPVLAGGVTGGEVFRKELALLSTLCLALAVGLQASAASRQRFKAARLALSGMLMFLLGPVVLQWLTSLMLPARWAGPPGIDLLSPLTLVIRAGDVRYRAAPSAFWISWLLLALLTGLVFLRAGFRLSRAVLDDGTTETVAAVPITGEPALPLYHRRWLPQYPSPLEWLVRRQRGVRAALWGAALLSVFNQGSGFFFPFWARSGGVLVPQLPSLTLSVLAGVLLAWAASRFFLESRRTGELELLLTTPLGAETVVQAQWHAWKRLLAAPLVLVLAVTVLRSWPWFWSGSAAQHSLNVAFILSYALNVLLSFVAVTWLSMWFGLRAHGPGQAIAWTVGLAKGTPFLIGTVGSVLFYKLMNSLAPFGFPTRRMPLAFMLVSLLPQAAILLFQAWVIVLAKRRLSTAGTCVEPAGLAFRGLLRAVWRESTSTLREVRHWTPGT